MPSRTIARLALGCLTCAALIGIGALLAAEKDVPKKAAASQASAPGVAAPEGPHVAVEIAGTPLPLRTAVAKAERAAEADIRRKLRKRIDVEFVDTALKDALSNIAERAGIKNLQIDENLLAEEGIALDEPVRRSLDGITVAGALELVLKPLELTWVIERESLCITTQVKADERLTTRVYPVVRLLEILAEQKRQSFNSQASKRQQSVDRSGFEVELSPDGAARATLVDLLQGQSAGPWEAIDGSGGTISIAGDTLVVRQTREGHEEVAALLRGLEQFADGAVKQGALDIQPDWYDAEADAPVWRALAKKTRLDLVEVNVKHIAEFLSDLHGIRIVLNENALAEEGIDLEEATTLQVADVTLRSAIGLILEPRRMTALVRHGMLEFTTQVNADERVDVVLYDVCDLLPAADNMQPLIDAIQQETEGPWEATDGSGGTLGTGMNGALVVRQTQKVQGEIAVLLDDLRETQAAVAKERDPKAEEKDGDEIELRFYPASRRGIVEGLQKSLVAFIAPGSWKENGAIQVIGDTLAVRQSRKVHREIRQFLDELKNAESGE